MQPSEFIRQTKEALYEKGWHQGGLQDYDTGRVCMRGAEVVVRDSLQENKYSDWLLADHYISKSLPKGEYSIPVFNDRRTTQFDDVIDCLDRAEKAAAQAEENGAADKIRASLPLPYRALMSEEPVCTYP